MEPKTRVDRAAVRGLAAFLALAFVASPLLAASMNYGNFTGANVTFNNVTESSATDPIPLWGAPTVSGNGLLFTPTSSFAAFSSGGGAPDTTDGRLTTTIDANNPNIDAIHTISLHELGDFTLTGVGTAVTKVTVSAPVFLILSGVDGTPVTPFPIFAGNALFTPSGGTYILPTDAGSGVIWTGSLNVNVDALLTANSIDGRATEIAYQMDNVLTATSESGSSALIEKKSGIVSVTMGINVPEPSTAVLALFGAMALGWHIRRRRAG